MRVLTVTLLLLVATVAPAAAQTPQEDLDAARAQWAAAGIRDYAFTIDDYCFCEGADPQESVVRDGVAEKGRTVEDLFATIQRSIDAKPYRFSAVYGEHGVPSRMDRDDYENVADDTYGFTVKDFRRLEPARDELADARAAWKASGIRRHSVVVTRRCEGRRVLVRRDWTVPRLHDFIARRPGATVRYGRHGIPRSIVARDCRYAVTRFRRGR